MFELTSAWDSFSDGGYCIEEKIVVNYNQTHRIRQAGQAGRDRCEVGGDQGRAEPLEVGVEEVIEK
jgi:hypothetical protein